MTSGSQHQMSENNTFFSKQCNKARRFSKTWPHISLVAKDGGVLRRTGHTEAAIDLARLAGYKPAGVVCEIMNEDGTLDFLNLKKLQKNLI